MHTSSSLSSVDYSTGFSTSASIDNELLVAGWLDKLLKHFGLGELDGSSERKLVAMLEHCGEDGLATIGNRSLLLDLKHKIMRTAGARLDSAFVVMASEVIDEEDVEAIAFEVENRKLQGLRHQGEVYRLTDEFLPCHRLQAFCLGQTLDEQNVTFIITQSAERFAVWVDVQSFPHHSADCLHLPAVSHLFGLGRS